MAENKITVSDVYNELAQVVVPGENKDIVAMGLIKGLVIKEGKVSFNLSIPPGPGMLALEGAAKRAIEGLPGVQSVEIKTQVAGSKQGTVAPSGTAGQPAPAHDHSGHAHGAVGGQTRPSAAATPGSQTGPGFGNSPAGTVLLPDVRFTIAIASGKGGVGKSTVATNLAGALARLGNRVGLLDADIYGPSIPAMMGVRTQPEFNGEKLVPLNSYGVKIMSLGVLLDPNKPVIWRGPMVAGAVRQLLADVDWGTLDYLLIDLPPGTGDAQLTLCQSIPLSGVVIVSTPQDVALNIATKALSMFKEMRVPILGMIENMSYYVCPDCGHRANIFSHGGTAQASARIGVPFLGEIPLDESIRVSGDTGRPVTALQPDSPQSQVFDTAAQNMISQVQLRNPKR